MINNDNSLNFHRSYTGFLSACFTIASFKFVIKTKDRNAMKKSTNQNQMIKNCLGYNRQHCAQTLSNQGIDSIEFGHWLAIPSQQLLLVFRHQQCVAVDDYQVAA